MQKQKLVLFVHTYMYASFEFNAINVFQKIAKNWNVFWCKNFKKFKSVAQSSLPQK